ncbi:Fcf2 pre-rRNA processing-domain-containing protein [Crepidotus variabilis]|uniref:Fcf2 pre-rRNA processing-domain-containing protein n=1 Tax=Crepidotus variabilis TaxID=179855 RepID=A0A9P6JP96_9AGAR|nr:Fcf2 pre-rRNA processing-domain-containing protein [Crepidotus variabilis]
MDSIDQNIEKMSQHADSSGDSESSSGSDHLRAPKSIDNRNSPRNNKELSLAKDIYHLDTKGSYKEIYVDEEEDVIILQGGPGLHPIPLLNPGKLPLPYINLGKSRWEGPSSIRDPEVERATALMASWSIPAPPIPPPELTKSGKPLTKREKKELRQKTAGPDWFDLPAPSEADLPRMYREVEALRLRNQLDPKRFYKKDEGEGKGIKGLPRYFAIGQILPSTTPFGGTASSDNLTKSDRKRTLVEELVDDAETKRYAKKKYEDLSSARGAKGKNTLRAKQALRAQKW